MLNNQTELYLSASASPSNFGVTVYNELFRRHGINAVYLPRRITDEIALVAAIRALSVRGCSVSMPLKSRVLPLLDDVDPLARELDSVNTIVRREDRLVGYNTDHYGLMSALRGLDPSQGALVYGAGAVSASVIKALRALGFKRIAITARRLEQAREVATRRDVSLPDGGDYGLLVNATPASRIPPDVDQQALIERAQTLFDLVIAPSDTPWLAWSRARGTRVISGLEMGVFQFEKQFELYTGIKPALDEIRAIVAGFYR